MLLDFWLAAHESAVSDIAASMRPRRPADHLRWLALSAVTIGVPGGMIYEQLPGLKATVFVELGVVSGALVLGYTLKLIRYPASRIAWYRQEIARLRQDLGQREIAESCMVALSEFLSEMGRLQTEEVRSQAQFAAWQRDYQAVVQSTYTLISKGISNSAALTFVSYPVSELRYWRGAFSDDHARTKSILEKYTIKLNAIIQGHYLAMRRDPALKHYADEDAARIAAAA